MAAVIATLSAGCAGPTVEPYVPEAPIETFGVVDPLHPLQFSTDQDFGGPVALQIDLYNVSESPAPCALLLGVSSIPTEGELLLVFQDRKEGEIWEWETVHYDTFSGQYGATSTNDIRREHGWLFGAGQGSLVLGINYTQERFAEAELFGNISFLLVTASVGPLPGQDTFPPLGGNSLLVDLRCDEPTSFGLRISREALMLTSESFDEATAVHEGYLTGVEALSNASSERTFAAPEVEILGHYASAGAFNVTRGTLRVEGPSHEWSWDLLTPEWLRLHAEGGTYRFELDRIGVSDGNAVLIAAVGWNPAASFEGLYDLPTLR